jgi:hypothetical protein
MAFGGPRAVLSSALPLLTVLRYVERNLLRVGSLEQAED